MEMSLDKNRLGVALLVSLFFHLVLLFIIAAISSVNLKPVVPKARDYFVEIFDGTVEKKSERPAKEVKRFGKENNRVDKEQAPAPSAPSTVVPRPHPAQKEFPRDVTDNQIKDLSSPEKSHAHTSGQIPLMQERLKKKETEEAVKELPSLNALMPSYQKLALQHSSVDSPRHVDVGNAVSLNTTEFKYISYFSKIKRQIQMVWKYPEAARREGIKGILLLKFSINREGHLTAVHLLRSSGSSLLDNAAIAALRDADPFFPLPDNLGEELEIAANFEYELNGYYFR